MFTAWDMENPFKTGNEYALYHVACPRRLTPEFHSHDFYEVYFFIAGDVSAYIEQYAYRLHPCDVVIFPPGVMHRAFFHNTEAYYERMLIYITRSALRLMGDEDCSLLDTIDRCIARRQFRFSLSEDNFQYCKHAIHEMIEGAIDGVPPYQGLINRCKMNLLMALLCKWFGETEQEQVARAPNRIAAVIAYINEHLCEALSLDTLSSRFFISKYHLMREFKSYTNRTIYQYILSKRINQAKLMLHGGGGPVDVCQRCGFGDYSSFYRAFRKETGISPNQYGVQGGHVPPA